MKKINLKYIFILVSSLTITIIVTFSIKNFSRKPLMINQCAATINENNTGVGIKGKYQRVISISNGKGFAIDTGVLYEEESNFRLNRFYTFSLKLISGNKYELNIIANQRAYDDNVPDITLKRFRPDQVRKNHVTSIEEVESGVWLFSGLAFPLFACKEPKHD